MEILYEDNHIIIVNKEVGELVQGDKTGDKTLLDKIKDYIKEKYNKPGNVYCGLVHRLDRPTSGAIVLAKTSKALSRMNDLFRKDDVTKTYWAITANRPEEPVGTLKHYLQKNNQQNKSYAFDKTRPEAKEAILGYRLIASSDRYYLLDINLKTGRHHQIRCQLAQINCPIKGDLKYGAPRSNADGGISLHARSLSFTHPVSGDEVSVIAPVPNDNLWKAMENLLS